MATLRRVREAIPGVRAGSRVHSAPTVRPKATRLPPDTMLAGLPVVEAASASPTSTDSSAVTTTRNGPKMRSISGADSQTAYTLSSRPIGSMPTKPPTSTRPHDPARHSSGVTAPAMRAP